MSELTREQVVKIIDKIHAHGYPWKHELTYLSRVDGSQRATIQQLREAVDLIESSRMILLNTFCQWQVGYGEGKHALRNEPYLRATIQQQAERIEKLEAELESHAWTVSPAMAQAKIEQQAETIAAHDGIKTKLEIKIQEQAERIKALEETNRIAALAVAERDAELARLKAELYWAASQHASILGHRTPEDEARTRAILQQGPPPKKEA